MRKALKTAAILAVCAAAFICVAAGSNKPIFANGESYTFFVGDTSLNCREITVSGYKALYARLTLSDICGECATYSSLDTEKFLNDIGGEIVFTESLSDSVNYYCRAPLPYCATLYGEEINLHICVRDDGVKVASPIIFGGY